jgi:hypothetical protein
MKTLCRCSLAVLATATVIGSMTAATASAEMVTRQVSAPEEPLPSFIWELSNPKISGVPSPQIGLGNFDQVPTYASAIFSNVRGFRQFRRHYPEPRRFDYSRLWRWGTHNDDFMRFFRLDVHEDGKYNYLDALEWISNTGILSTHGTYGPLNRAKVLRLFRDTYGNAAFNALAKGSDTLNINGMWGIDQYDGIVLLNELRNNLDRFQDFGGTAAQIAEHFAMIEGFGEIGPGGLPIDGGSGGGSSLIIPEPASLALLALGGLALLRRR